MYRVISISIGVIGLFLFNAAVHAQPDTTARIQISIKPDRPAAIYKTGEPVTFRVTVLDNGRPIPRAEIYYEVGPEKMPPAQSGALTIKGSAIIKGGTLSEPGFLRCIVTMQAEGKTYRNLCTVGFDPLQINAYATAPADFLEFWNNSIAASSKIPLEPVFTPIPERSTDKVNVYEISFNHYSPGGKLYGILCVPKKEGKYPAVITFPGAGVWPLYGNPALAEKGVITLDMGIHGIPMTLNKELYPALNASALNGYFMFNLDNRDLYYHKRVFLGCIKAIDFLFTLDAFDGKRLAVDGGSQGGALAIVAAALDKRVNYIASLYPALSDLTGYLHGRAGGAPQMFRIEDINDPIQQKKIETSRYYDIVNFARLLKAPGFYLWGFNDEACAPTSTYAAYNVITAPKELFTDPTLGHWSAPDQWERVNNWILKKFNEHR
ncbi:MAG: acetylxylan esterase [Chitinophagaceae bacterium]|nr:acetylxylan esterase [Chitinophagaceae bacterium]